MVERQDVTIRVDSANVNRTGTYSLNLSIENQSDRPFAFVPLFAEVLTSSGEKVKARYTFEAGESGSVVAEPGQILRGKVTILGQPWVTNDKQDLTLLIKEGTSNSRVFRIPI
jgi:archaellum component FlaG (FlaF/FlaG flagellin family)